MAANDVNPAVPTNRLEALKEEERQWAKDSAPSSQALTAYLAEVPSPGAAELDASAFVHCNGGKTSVSIRRDEQGEYTIKMALDGRLALVAGIGAGVGAGAAATWKVRTPEAAGDLLDSLARGSVNPSAAARVKHYSAEGLRQFELNDQATANLHLPLPLMSASGEFVGKQALRVDLDRHSLIVEQGVALEGSGRYGAVMFGGGVNGEVQALQRTEMKLSPEAVEQLSEGHFPTALLRGVETKHTLVLEAQGEAESMVLLTREGNLSRQSKYEAEIDLDAAVASLGDPEQLKRVAHRKVTTLVSEDVNGSALEAMVGTAHVSAARYAVIEEELGEEAAPNAHALHRQLESGLLQSAPR